MSDRTYYVYMMTNRWHNVLYTGVTNSLERRVWEHKHGSVRGFTKQYNCDRLVYFEEFAEIDLAIECEKRIKGLVTGEEGCVDRAAESRVEGSGRAVVLGRGSLASLGMTPYIYAVTGCSAGFAYPSCSSAPS